jgi:hypothetical protein
MSKPAVEAKTGDADEVVVTGRNKCPRKADKKVGLAGQR